MMQAAIIFSRQEWLVPIVIILAAAAAVSAWSYWKSPAPPVLRLCCFFLKILGLASLALCLLEPLWTFQKARPGANLFGVLADNSQGMQIKDRDATQSRGQSLQAILNAGPDSWQEHLAENFQIRRYQFDTHLHAVHDFGELNFNGGASAILTSLKSIRDRFQGQPLAGLLLFTDGNATDAGNGLPDLTGLPPVYPVLMGKDDPIKDLSLLKVTVSQTAFEDAPVTVQADVSATGFDGENILVQLFEETTANTGQRIATNAPALAVRDAGKAVAEQTLRARKSEDVLAFRFELKPEKRGISFYTVRASVKGDSGQSAQPAASAEATLINNRQVVAVDRGKGPYRVLYVSGRPNWEFKFLNRALLSEETQVELVALIRIARREPKFDFRGRAGETSNPLFRGFDRTTEETERYDQPVLIRLNTKDEFELRGGFPKTAEELYAYHAIIIDDLEGEFFSREQMMLLQKFVSDRGGGMMMMGGQECFQEGSYQRTPVGDMLPIYLDRPVPDKPGKEYRLSFTREGWLQPWVRLRSTEAEENTRLDEMPAFLVLNPAREIKPGASALAVVTDEDNQKFPALVAQRFGHGRTLALMVGDLWRWGMKDDLAHRDMDKLWRQIIRWLVADVPNRVALHAENQMTEGNPSVRLEVRVKDKTYEPLENGTVAITIEPVAPLSVGGAAAGAVKPPPVRLPAEPSQTEPGLYEAVYVPHETGGFKAVASVQDAEGAEVATAEAGWSSDPAADEFRSLKPNRTLLETIAQKTGGEIITPENLGALVKGLPNRKAPVTETVTSPLWHTPLLFLFALACITAEWGLRRWKGLA